MCETRARAPLRPPARPPARADPHATPPAPAASARRYNYTTLGSNLTPSDVAAVCIFLVSIVAGPIAFGLSLVYLGQHRAALSGSVAAGILAGHVVLAAVGTYFVWDEMLQPSNVFVAYPFNVDSLRVLMGAMLTVVYPSLGVAAASVLSGYWCSCRGARAAGVPPRAGGGRSVQPTELKHNWHAAAFAVAAVAAVGVAASFLSPVWNYSPPSYFGFDSPFSLVRGVSVRFGPDPAPGNPQHLVPPVIVVKLYEDVLVFYCVLLGLAAAGLLATYHAPSRRVLHTRVAPRWLRALPAWLAGEWRHGLCLGELGVLVALGGLTAYWALYWTVRYSRIATESAAMNDPFPAAQNAARVLGHMTSLFMALSTFPVARGGALEALFGVPFDRGIKYHRALGRAVWLCVSAHMVVWQAKWAAEGVLWNNVFAVSSLLITGFCTPGLGGPPDCQLGLHGDNWTVPIVEMAWLVLTVALLFATLSRRFNYELFHYTHHAVWLFFLAGLVHAWSHWYYVTGGLVLYLVDKLARTVKASGSATLVGAVQAGGVTALTLEVGDVLTNGHYAGQYVFLNIPAVDPLQWHPYTISSPPGVVNDAGEGGPGGSDARARITIHVKSMGAGTWSDRVGQLAAALADDAAGGSGGARVPAARRAPLNMPVSVDGPYGRPGHYASRRCVVLVAGGIGVTPMHAIMADLHARACDPDVRGAPGAVTRVHLVWTVREAALIGHFGDSLVRMLKSNPAAMFSVAIHVTGSALAADALEPLDEAEGYEAAPGFPGHEVSHLESPPPARGGGSPRRLSGGFGGASSPASESLGAPLMLRSGSLARLDGAAGGADGGPSPVAAGLCSARAYRQLRALAEPGRPRLDALLERLAQETVQEHYADGGGSDFALSDLLTVMVCGPPGMIDEASGAAADLGADFHSEVFHF